MRDNRYQGGSLGGYIIVAVLLALALIGGLYGLQRWNASRQLAQEESSDSSASREEESNTNSSDNAAKQDAAKKEAEAKAQQEAARQKEAAAEKQKQAQSQAPATGSTNGTAKLPATGPADTAYNAAVISLIVFAFVSYYTSRRWTSLRD